MIIVKLLIAFFYLIFTYQILKLVGYKNILRKRFRTLLLLIIALDICAITHLTMAFHSEFWMMVNYIANSLLVAVSALLVISKQKDLIWRTIDAGTDRN
jgi:hypothetical protein